MAESGSSYSSMEQDNSSSRPVSAAAVVPSPDNLQGLSASEKMQALQQVQQVSRQAVTKMPNSNPYYANAPKTIDIRMYDQLVVAHNRQSQKLSDANSHVGVLEAQINQCNEDLIAAFELMKQVGWQAHVHLLSHASAYHASAWLSTMLVAGLHCVIADVTMKCCRGVVHCSSHG